MERTEFERVFPIIRDWIQATLAAHAPEAKAVGSLNFPRLSQYYSRELLSKAKAVFVDRVPVPPLSKIGLAQFSDFENMGADGITYLDTYFVKRREAQRESLHFHELVHVIQWKVLGVERFLAAYADGLERHSYRNSPLEVMAYDHESRFKTSPAPYDVEAKVTTELQRFA